MFIHTAAKGIPLEQKGMTFLSSHNGEPDTDPSLLLDNIYEVTPLLKSPQAPPISI